jgi:hypothetical protein
MLYGYEDWQNDWWIRVDLQRGLFGSFAASGLAWIEPAGFRALPPIDQPALLLQAMIRRLKPTY